MRFLMAQDDHSDEHDDVHDQVQLRVKGRENPVGAVDGGHEDKHSHQRGHNEGLGDQYIDGDAIAVQLLKERGQNPVPGGNEKPLAGSQDPGSDFTNGTADNKQGNDRGEPVQVIGL